MRNIQNYYQVSTKKISNEFNRTNQPQMTLQFFNITLRKSKSMMKRACGPLNTKGFTAQVSKGQLPNADHITYAGVFNEIQFDVGQKTDKITDLHIGFCRASNPTSATDQNVNEFLAIFTKGCADGEPRDDRILNAVIVLDISGSMGMALNSKQQVPKTRLQLSKEAIKMFVSKLRPSDSFGLVTFDDKGYTVLNGMKKSEIDMETVFAMVDSIKTQGGTTLSSGFNQGLKVMRDLTKDIVKDKGNYENRLIMLTDVGDNSMSTTNKFIQDISTNGINTTIIGISSEFRSDICEQLNEIRGFNYFCAVETDDLKKYLFQNFDWTFFPSSYDMEIILQSDNIKFFQVFGSSDSDKVKTYNNFGKKGLSEYIITKSSTGFPSELSIVDGVVKTIGGLFLVKMSPQSNLESFSGKVILKYKTIKGDNLVSEYPIKYQFPKNQQFFSQKCLQQATSAFYFVHEVKNLISSMKSVGEHKFQKQNYLKAFESLKAIAPESKLKELDGIVNIVKNYRN